MYGQSFFNANTGGYPHCVIHHYDECSSERRTTTSPPRTPYYPQCYSYYHNREAHSTAPQCPTAVAPLRDADPNTLRRPVQKRPRCYMDCTSSSSYCCVENQPTHYYENEYYYYNDYESEENSRKRYKACGGSRRSTTRRRRMVSFDLSKNEIHGLGRPSVMDSNTKKSLWYNGKDFAQFYASLRASRQALLEGDSSWMDALAAAYANRPDWRYALAQVYAQNDDLVGMEYHVLRPNCRADVSARKQALRRTVTSSNNNNTVPAHDRELQLKLLSQKFSRRSSSFCSEIARAQSQALAWMPPY